MLIPARQLWKEHAVWKLHLVLISPQRLANSHWLIDNSPVRDEKVYSEIR